MAAASTHERLAGLLGRFGLGLGLVQLAAPGSVNRLAGIRDDATSQLWQRIVGARELVAFAAIEAERPRPARALWMRVGGDAKDLALLGLAHRDRRGDAQRLAAAIAAVAGVAALDLYAAVRASRGHRERPAGPMHLRAAITVRKPRDEVARFWREHEELHGFVGDGRAARFVDAPRNQGTEVRVELDAEMPGGRLGAAVAHLRGREPAQRAKDDLRRVKRVLETGSVVSGEPRGPADDPEPGAP